MEKDVKKAQTRAQILAGAGSAFRSQGYGAAGVDGVAKAAGVTSGAFYAHFKSKADAFRETVAVGMRDLERAIRNLRTQNGASWRERFVEFYLGEKRTCAPGESCALQSLTGEVARADAQTRETFQTELGAVIDATAEGLEGASSRARRDQAIVLLALLSGGVSLARAVRDPKLSEEIARAIRSALISVPAPPTRATARASTAKKRA